MDEASGGGALVRDTRYLDGRVPAEGQGRWPVEPGRYQLVVSRTCPWADRAVIVRRLLGLESVLSVGVAGPTHDRRSWTFDLDPGGVDPMLGIHRLADAHERARPGYDRGMTVPAVVDIPTGAVVTSNYPMITIGMETEWTAHHRRGAPELYPEAWRSEIDEVSEPVYRDVDKGVYAAGFARSQEAYEAAYRRLFDQLDWLSDLLTTRRYLVGDHVTEADVPLFTTLVRFDAVYHGHFKCKVHADINPTGVVPAGPDLSGWLAAHRREELGGSPYGRGATPPGPPPAGEVVTEGHSPLLPGRSPSSSDAS